ncbi:MAG: glycosyltransferase family 2 protein [Saprospiraceae bacterium]|nr:glycosyltransferase family 2 protein [Saprospiraceae bacterium]
MNTKAPSPFLSVIVCVYNEEPNIRPLVEKIRVDLNGLDYELLYVDDGSTDGTLSALKAVMDERMRVVEFRKNYGQSAALAAGIAEAKGVYLATLDGDLQNDPADIPGMLRLAVDEGWDLVAGERANRQDGMLLRKIPSRIANAIIRKSTGVYIRDYGCTLKVFRSEVAKDMGLYGELHRFIPVLASLEGARITQVPVRHHARIHGQSKYGIGRTFRVVSDLLLMVFFRRYLQKPMHLFGTAGVLAFGVGVLINLYLLGLKLAGNDIWGKPLLILGVILLLGGIQLVTIGIITEIMMRTYYESQNKTVYRIRRIHPGSRD